MPKAIYIEHDGTRVEAEIPSGTTLMRAAGDHGVTGILGDCGGVMSCASCHVYVVEPYGHLLKPPGDEELGMLEFTAAPRTSASRLSCQIVMADELDGITVQVAFPQV